VRKSESMGTAGAGLRQVAERAGISVATASAILSSSRSNTRFSAGTRERVLNAAQELRYQPNALARALTGQPTRTIGVLFGLERASVAVASPYVFTVLQGIVAAAAEARYNVTLFTEPWHGASVSAGAVRDGRTDGIIVIAPTSDSDILSYLAEFEIPVVSITSPVEEGLAPSVDIDNVAGARMATEYLVSLGHRRIAHLTGDYILRSGVERRDSFLSTMAQAGLPVPPPYLVPGLYTFQSGFEGGLHLLSLPIPPTAIFAASDNIAQGLFAAARQMKVAVPDQLSIIGFDDLPDSLMMEPPLTTIRQPLVEIGEEAARLLLRRVRKETVLLKPNLFPPTLVVRASTAPPLSEERS
jgi:DNA-binding LacI/PurR family transcriptional regulator